MTRLLFVNGCVNREKSRTLRLARELISRIKADEVEEIVLEEARLIPLNTARLQKREGLALAGKLDDHEFSEARRYASADILVVATPFWEFGFNSMTKIYLENVSQLGISFVYTDDGVPKGLTNIKRAYYVTTRGGFTDDDHDLGFMMFKEVLGMHGAKDVKILGANALDIVGNDPESILNDAISRIGGLLRHPSHTNPGIHPKDDREYTYRDTETDYSPIGFGPGIAGRLDKPNHIDRSWDAFIICHACYRYTTGVFIMGYRLIHNDCFVVERGEYEPGEPVRARFPWIATDTSYEFFIDAANVRQEYVNGEMVFLFIMPGHDVNMSYTSRNTMMRDPRLIHPEALGDGDPLWVCEACGAKNEGKYCYECGSARPKPKKRSTIDGSARDRS